MHLRATWRKFSPLAFRLLAAGCGYHGLAGVEIQIAILAGRSFSFVSRASHHYARPHSTSGCGWMMIAILFVGCSLGSAQSRVSIYSQCRAASQSK